MIVRVQVLTDGTATGRTIRLTEPLSFWGGTDDRGRIVDRRHPQYGAELAGRVLLMESGRGSSSSASVLAEQIRVDAAPAAIVLTKPDAIVVLGAVVAAELYRIDVPILVADAWQHAEIPAGVVVRVDASRSAGTIRWGPQSPPGHVE